MSSVSPAVLIVSVTDTTSSSTSSSSFVLTASSVQVYFSVAFQVLGKSSDGYLQYAKQSSALKSSISSGNFTSILKSTAATKGNTILTQVTSSSMIGDIISPTISVSTYILPSSSPSSAPTKYYNPTSKPTTSPTIYYPPTSSPTSYPSSTTQLPQISSISAIASKTTITAYLSLTARRLSTSGFVYCLALSNSSAPRISQLISLGSAAAFSNMSLPLSVTMSGLIPLKIYYIFCGLQTSTGFKSSNKAIIATRQYIFTKCCRPITFTSFPVSVYGDLTKYSGSAAKYTFYYSISYLPDSILYVTPSLTALSSSSSKVSSISIFPSSTTFSKSTTSTIGSIVLSGDAYTEGTYSLSFKISSTDRNTSLAYSIGSATISIISSTSPLPAPNMTLAIFSNSGSSVTVRFDIDTEDRKSVV